MRALLVAIVAFIAGLVGGWFASMAFYLAYLAVTGRHDHDGGGAMAYGLVIGPLVGIVAGIVLATVAVLWMTGGRRTG
jgi:hypothetical protein